MIGITRYRSFIPIGLRTFILRKFFVITTGFDTSFDMSFSYTIQSAVVFITLGNLNRNGT